MSQEEKVQLKDLIIHIDGQMVIHDDNRLHRFTQRNNLSYRKLTHNSVKTAREVEEDILKFLQEVHELRREHNIPPELMLNFDETRIMFDQIPA